MMDDFEYDEDDEPKDAATSHWEFAEDHDSYSNRMKREAERLRQQKRLAASSIFYLLPCPTSGGYSVNNRNALTTQVRVSKGVHESVNPTVLSDLLFLRSLSERAMQSISKLVREVSPFESFCGLRLHRLEVVNNVIARAMQKYVVAFAENSGLERSLGLRIGCYYATHNRYGIDMLFNDLFALLLSKKNLVNMIRDNTHARKLLVELFTSPKFLELRDEVAGDPAKACVAAIILLEDGESGMAAACGKNAADKMEGGEIPQPSKQDLDNSPDRQETDGDETGYGDPDPQDDPHDGCGTTQERAGSKAFDQESVKSALGSALGEMKSNTVDDVEKAVESLAGEGFETAKHSRQQFQMIEQIVTTCFEPTGVAINFKMMCSLFGRLHGQITEAIAVSRFGDGELMSIESGNDLERMVAGDRALFSIDDPFAEMLFMKRYKEHELSIQHREGITDTGQGPMVLMVDISGSMKRFIRVRFDQDVEFTAPKVTFASAFALAVLYDAKRTRRRVFVCPYNDGIDKENCVEFNFATQNYTPAEIAEMVFKCLSGYTRGGTKFLKAFEGMLELLNKDYTTKDRYKQADVIYFSDGQDDAKGDVVKQINAVLKAFVSKYTMRRFGFFVGERPVNQEETKSLNALFNKWDSAVAGELTIVEQLVRFYVSILRETTFEMFARGEKGETK